MKLPSWVESALLIPGLGWDESVHIESPSSEEE